MMSRYDHSFTVPAATDAVADELRQQGWKVEEVGSGLTAQQGSQLRMRALGGWFVKAAHLPKKLSAEPDGGGTSIRVEDTFGVGLSDPRMKKRYAKAFQELESSLA